MWWSKNNFNPAGKTAVVVGASQGLGADIALRLYEMGCGVLLVARRETELKAQVERIRHAVKPRFTESVQTSDNESVGGSKGTSSGLSPRHQTEPTKNKEPSDCTTNDQSEPLLEYYICDTTDYEACTNMWNYIMDVKKIDPEYLFCCAGNSVPKLFADLNSAELAKGMNVNYMTAVNTCHSQHKAVLCRNEGVLCKTFKLRHIILFSSVAASFPFIGYGQYAPAKAALLSLSIILRQELSGYNYRVSCVNAGNFASEGYAEENKTKPEITKTIEGSSQAISTMECCELIFDQLAKGYDLIYTDFVGWVLGLSVLGVHPRKWGFFQVLMQLLFLILEPILYFFVIVLPIRKQHPVRVPKQK